MRVSGTLTYQDRNYVLMIDAQKHRTLYFLISPYHREDMINMALGQARKYPELSLYHYMRRAPEAPYIEEIVERKNVSGEMTSLGRSPILSDLLIVLRKCKTYSFAQSDVLRDDYTFEDGVDKRYFNASDKDVSIRYTEEDHMFSSLDYSDLNMTIKFDSLQKYKFPQISNFKLQPLDASKNKNLQYSHIKSLTYESLKNFYDDKLSWYEHPETHKILKDYRSIKTKEDFEQIVIMGIVNELKQARAEGRVLYPGVKAIMDLILDTETTGLEMYDMPPNVADEIVAIPLTWKADFGVTIFCGMHYFDNIDLNYVIDRLAPFFGKNFGEASDALIEIDTVEGPFQFRRSEINTSGHNDNFDIRAVSTVEVKSHTHKFVESQPDIDYSKLHLVRPVGKRHKFWFDDDTMSMSFNVNPVVIKKSNALKDLTRRLFGHMTPELRDLLGPGNENKYSYINDELVAIIYGCADADYSLQVLRKLRKLYQVIAEFSGHDLYRLYRKQDIPMLNVTSSMDFIGMRVHGEELRSAARAAKSDLDLIALECQRYVGRVLAIKNHAEEIRTMQLCGLKSALAETDVSVEDVESADQLRNLVGDVQFDTVLDQVNQSVHVPQLDLSKAPLYDFKLSGKSLTNTMYKVLEYPPHWTKPKKKKDGTQGKPKLAADKFTMKKLSQQTLSKPIKFLAADVIGANGKVLLSAEKANNCKYPLAYYLSVYGPRLKEYNSYFKPFLESGVEDRVYRNTSLTRIDTRRISNPLQTIKGDLKKLFLPHSSEYVNFDFDMSQVEIRIMFSLAGDQKAVIQMRNSEVDIHIEAAADMNDKPAYLVTKYERKGAKANNFGYPYGIGPYKMCEDLNDGKINDELLYKTRLLMERFKETRKQVVDYLNTVRDATLLPQEVPQEIRDFLGIGPDVPLGKVQSAFGFYKLFELDAMEDQKAERIRRQSGNYVIQEFAAELFRTVLWRFYLQCELRGYNDDERVLWHMLIHDELYGSYHKSIHPAEMCKMVKDSCFITLPGHTKYYVGMNIGNSWGEVKDDSAEIPVTCLERLVARYDAGEFDGEIVDDHKTYMAKCKSEYIRDRIGEVAEQLCGLSETNKRIDATQWLENLNNFPASYTVRKYLLENYKPLWLADKSDDSAVFEASTARWLLDKYGEGVVMNRFDGTRLIITSALEVKEEQSDVLDLALDEPDTYYDQMVWSLSDDEAMGFESGYADDSDLEDNFESYFDTEKFTGSFASLFKSETKTYSNVRLLNNKLTISVNRSTRSQAVIDYLQRNNLLTTDTKSAYECYIKLPLSRTSVGFIVKSDDYTALDEFIANGCKEVVSA